MTHTRFWLIDIGVRLNALTHERRLPPLKCCRSTSCMYIIPQSSYIPWKIMHGKGVTMTHFVIPFYL